MKITSAFPAAIYRDTVLSQIFTDAKRLFLSFILEIDFAHVIMLAEQKIISSEVASACLQALDQIDKEEILKTEYDGSCEDLFFLVERKLTQLCGVENAGKIHTARSRNDIDMTMYRMLLRKHLLQVFESAVQLRERLVELASEHRATLIPAYTHGQPAQPTTLGHYLIAMVEVLERDAERLQAAFTRVNRSPLGACAITTTGFPISRSRTADLLGFDDLQTNSYGAIASVDYIIESCSVLATTMLNLGRFTQDLLQWSTIEFGYLRLSDGYVQISSIMPQKRNPVPLEHVRILSSRALTESQGVLNALHNTPFADMNDSEDSLQPLVDLAFSDGVRALKLLEGILSEVSFDTARMEALAQANFLTVTELADTLVRATNISFAQAHHIVSAGVKTLAGDFDRKKMIAFVMQQLASSNVSLPGEDILLNSLDAGNFVEIRNVVGGPSPAALNPEIDRASAQVKWDQSWLAAQREHLQAASEELHILARSMQK